jgi:hypothetical protein
MTSASDLAGNIEKLLAEKKHHTEALNRIDSTLRQISDLLGVVAKRGPGRPPKTSAPAPKKQVEATPPLKGKRRWFSVTAEQSILDFIARNGSPTTKEVNKHWKAEGRGGTADNTLSLMVKHGKIKRIQVEGQKRSQYTTA